MHISDKLSRKSRLQDTRIRKTSMNTAPRMTAPSVSRASVLRSRPQKAISSLRLPSLLKNTTRNSANTELKLTMRIPRRNHILITRIIHRMMTTRRTNHRRRTAPTTLNPRNHRAIRTKKRMKTRRRAASARKPTMTFTEKSPSGLNITEKTLNRNLKKLTGKNCQNTVS